MPRCSLRLALWALFWIALQTSGEAHPYSVDDLLATEAYDQLLVDPTGHWLAFERLVPLDEASRFDMPLSVTRGLPYRVDLRHPEKAQPLLPAAAGPGTALYGFSPDGALLAIGRLDGGTWRLGVVVVATGAVRWFPVSPSYDPQFTTLDWVSDTSILLIAEEHRAMPWDLGIARAASDILPGRWRSMAFGQRPTATVIGSGRYASATPERPKQRLLSLDVETGRILDLARGDFEAISLSPDHRWAAVTEYGAAIAPDPGALLHVGTDTRRRRLLLADTRSGMIWRPCSTCDVAAGSYAWSSHGQLAAFARSDGDRWLDGRIWRFDMHRRWTALLLPAGIAPAVDGLPDAPAHVALGWRGRDLLIFAQRGASGRTDWYRLKGTSATSLTDGVPAPSRRLVSVEGCEATMLGAGQTWCLDRTPIRLLLPGASRVSRDSSGHLIGVGSDRSIRIADPNEKFDLPGSIGADDVRIVGWSASTRSLIADDHTGDHPEELLLVRPHVPPVTLATINRQFRDIDAVEPVPFPHRGIDGTLLTSWLYLPRGASPSHPAPLIVIPYPGLVFSVQPPASQSLAAAPLETNARLLVAHGYAVLMPSMPPFPAATLNPPRFADQIESAIMAIPARLGVDTGRTALWGHSFGAFAVATTVANSDRFRAAIVAAGAYDLADMHGAFSPLTRVAPEHGLSVVPLAGWVETGQPAMRTTPWSDPLRYVANSPVYRADRIHTPLLIIAADQDIASLDQGEALFSALYRQGGDAELLTYWGEGHVISSPPNVRDLYARVFAWLDPLLMTPAPLHP